MSDSHTTRERGECSANCVHGRSGWCTSLDQQFTARDWGGSWAWRQPSDDDLPCVQGAGAAGAV